MKVAAAILMLALSGCVTPGMTSLVSGIPSTWPKDWPATVPSASGSCPDISGTYRNLGVVAGNVAPAHSVEDTLSYRLFGRIDDLGTMIRITQLDRGLIRFDDLSNAKVIFSSTISGTAGDFSCASGGVAFRPTTSKSGGSDGGMVVQDSILLLPITGGDLAAKVEVKSAGLAFWLIPGGGVQRYWIKFDKLTDGA